MIRKIPLAQCKHKLISKKNALFLEVDIILNLTSKIMPLYLEVGRYKAGIASPSGVARAAGHCQLRCVSVSCMWLCAGTLGKKRTILCQGVVGG